MLLAGAPIRNLSATSPMRRSSSTDLCDPLLPERPCLKTNEGVNIKPKKQTQKIKLQKQTFTHVHIWRGHGPSAKEGEVAGDDLTSHSSRSNRENLNNQALCHKIK
jgi:hypothetical protein